MPDDGKPDSERGRLERTVARKEEHKLRARHRGEGWTSWLGTFGMVGWSIALPTLAGVALGLWLDRNVPGPRPWYWTLVMLLAGLTMGCLLAWYWVRRESRED